MNDTPIEHHLLDILLAAMALLIATALLTAFSRRFSSWYDLFLGWLQPGHPGTFPAILMIIFILLDVLLVGFIVFTIRRYTELVSAEPQKLIAQEHINPLAEIQESWASIELLIQSPNSSDWNMAILRADALLDDTLRDAGYEGATMADRLKIVDPTQIPSIDQVWSGHRLRNAIAHDPTDQHPREVITHALSAYRQAFKELGFMTATAAAPENLPFAETSLDQTLPDQNSS